MERYQSIRSQMNDKERAVRNALIRRWWAATGDNFKTEIIQLYARSLRCPVVEICPEMNEENDLEFLSKRFGGTIELFRQDEGDSEL